MDSPRHIRIFLSSPGDVADERGIAHSVLERLSYDTFLRGKISLEIVAWDKPGADTPMLATMTPQEAINQGLPLPSQCDIVVVLFWSRMGTPLPEKYSKPDGSRYLSGTEWEYQNAIEAAEQTGMPLIVIYRRTENIALNPRDSDFLDKYEQYKSVEKFFANFENAEGVIEQGYNQYEKPEDFRVVFEHHIKVLVNRVLEAKPKDNLSNTLLLEETRHISYKSWDGSPFPGLRAFTEEEEPIFFGRGREVDALIDRVRSSRFVSIVGASGSGKSSLVGAGLIPRLRNQKVEQNNKWYIIRCKLGKSPFNNLAQSLINSIPALEGDPIEVVARANRLAEILAKQPDNMHKTLSNVLQKEFNTTQVLIFIDQFEELFTLASGEDLNLFVNMLNYQSSKIRVVVTIRADFYHRALNCFEEQLRSGTFTLNKPSSLALHQMIIQPATVAGLTFEPGLPERIIEDTGDEPGALSLLAYALDELYKLRNLNYLTHSAYEEIGGVQKAIGFRAEEIFEAQHGSEKHKEEMFFNVFRRLIKIDEHGILTRNLIQIDIDNEPEEVREMINAFTDARLLILSQDAHGATLDVAHEALFGEWKRLGKWIDSVQNDIYFQQRLIRDAIDWHRAGLRDDDLYRGEKLIETVEWMKRNKANQTLEQFVNAAITKEDLDKKELQSQMQKYRETEVQILKNTIVRNVSHELLTPLLQVKSAVALIDDDGDGDKKLIGYAANAVSRLESHVKNISMLSQALASTYEARPMILLDAIEYAKRNLSRTWTRRIDIERIKVNLDTNLPPVLADKQAISMVLQLLMDNALKFGEENNIEIKGELVNDKAKVSIQDYGIGIAEDDLTNIFTSFTQANYYSATRPYGGAGVGLTIVKSILDGHGTEIYVDSTVNVGSTFWFELPIVNLD